MSSWKTATVIRCILGPLLIGSAFYPSLFQPFLDDLWRRLLENRVYNWSTFETIWTVFWYAFTEVSLTAVFVRRPVWRYLRSRSGAVKLVVDESAKARSLPRGMRRPSRRIGEILTYIAPLLTMDLIMIKKFAGVELNAMLASGNYTPHNSTDMAFNDSTSSWSTPRKTFLVPTLHNFSLSSPLQTTRALPLLPPSSDRLASELIASFFIYDTLFFLFHLTLHVVPLLRRWHAPHHTHDAQLNPQVTNQLSTFERLGLVMLANLSLNVIGAHVMTRTLFVPIFVWLLVEIHSGMDLPWAYDKVLPRGWGGGAEKHMAHHSGKENGYEPFFCWWDGVWERVGK